MPRKSVDYVLYTLRVPQAVRGYKIPSGETPRCSWLQVGLAKMTSLGYLDLLHDLIRLDRVRQLANAHRKTGHIPTNSKTINAANSVAATQSAPDNRQQPHKGGKGIAPVPWKKGDAIIVTEALALVETAVKITASTNRRYPRCSAEGKHHPFHCPGPLSSEGSKAVEEKIKSPTTTLTLQNVLIAGTTTPVSTSPLRSTTVRVLSLNGSVPITGLFDTETEMTAISQNTMDTLVREGVEVPQPKLYSTNG
ncbi:hypothetical protein FOL47_001400 [Perkinsus chesapeaki]|uniref:Uncharacterized protein n=1 Tax=Perkinsus chesapeaki TaxID=330153 RepID=A0A7J6KUD5_PERCH|nr:hypothetical protein FOL47_001400 [Perkinsus chesapeaki]